MTFQAPFFLGVGAALVLLAALALWSQARRRGRLAEALGGRRAARRLAGVDLYRIRLERLALLALAAAALSASAAEPRWRDTEPESPPPPPVRSVVLAIDVSMSMQANDVEPTRLIRSVQVARELLDTLADDRVGLVLFAGKAYPIAPPTHDHQALRYFLEGIVPTIASAYDPGTLVSVAIRESVALLDREEAPEAEATGELASPDGGASVGERAIILIGDGGSGEPDSEVASAARAAAEEGIRLHAIGVGTRAGGEMSVPAAPYQLERRVVDPGGAPAVSTLDEALLVRISEAGGGSYALVDDGVGLGDVREALSRPPRPTEPRDAPSLWARYDLGIWLAACALLFLLMESLMDVRLPRGWSVSVRRPA